MLVSDGLRSILASKFMPLSSTAVILVCGSVGLGSGALICAFDSVAMRNSVAVVCVLAVAMIAVRFVAVFLRMLLSSLVFSGMVLARDPIRPLPPRSCGVRIEKDGIECCTVLIKPKFVPRSIQELSSLTVVGFCVFCCAWFAVFILAAAL